MSHHFNFNPKGITMVQMKPLSHTLLSHELLASYARDTMAIIEIHAEDAFIIRQKSALESIVSEMDSAFQRKIISDFTKQLADLDTRRDRILVAIRSALNAAIAQEFLDAVRAEAASQIKVAMDKMPKSAMTLGYKEESAVIVAFLSAVKEMGTTATTAGVQELITALDSTETEFDSLFSEKIDSDGNSDKVRSIRSIRKSLTKRLDGLFGYLDLNGTDLHEQYGATVTSMNQLTGEFMAKAKATETRKESLSQ